MIGLDDEGREGRRGDQVLRCAKSFDLVGGGGPVQVWTRRVAA